MESEDKSTSSIKTIYKTQEYMAFFNALAPKVQLKFRYVYDVISSVYNIPTKFVKHLQNTDLFEMRVSVQTNIGRYCLLLTIGI